MRLLLMNWLSLIYYVLLALFFISGIVLCVMSAKAPDSRIYGITLIVTVAIGAAWLAYAFWMVSAGVILCDS